MLAHLAAPRVAAVQGFFKTTSKTDLFGSYAWCQAVASGLLPILGDFEIALRNALHRALSLHYGGVNSYPWMLKTPHPSLATNPNAPLVPAAHKMGAKMQDDIARIEARISHRKSVTPDDIVAALPFGFWEQLIKNLDHNSHKNPALQGKILAHVFPFAPDVATVPHGDSAFKVRILNLLNQIREVRNRIGHHDSVWGCPEFNAHGVKGFYPRRPRHSVNSLLRLANNIAWLAGWIDPSITDHIYGSDHWAALHRLLCREALAIYRHTGGRTGTTERLFALESGSPLKRARRSKRRAAYQQELLSFEIVRFHY